MKNGMKVGAGTAGPVGNAKEIESQQGAGSADVSLRDLAASIGAHAEAHKSSDSGWSKVKSAADAARNGVKSEIARLIRELAEIDDQAAKGFQTELSVLVAGKKTGALSAGNSIDSGNLTQPPPRTAAAAGDDKSGDAESRHDTGGNEENSAQPAGGNGVGRAVVKPGTVTWHAAAAENLTPPAPKPQSKNKAAGNPTTVPQGEQNKESEPDVPTKTVAPLGVPGIATPRCFSVDIGKLQPHPRAKGKFKIYDKEFAALKTNMAIVKFDPRHPIIVVSDGKGGFWVVDGLSRLRAAQELGISEVYVMLVKFSSDEELDYFIATTQLLRRERTDAVLVTVAAIIIPVEEERAKARQGARNELATSTHRKVKVSMSSSDAAGVILHCSGSTVDKIKKILANPEYSRKVMSDEIKIGAAYREIMAAQRPLKPAETDKPAAGAVDGNKAPMESKSDDENSGKPGMPTGDAKNDTLVDNARDLRERGAGTQQDPNTSAGDMDITMHADDPPPAPAIQSDTVNMFQVPGKLLSVLLSFAPEDSRQKLYGLMTVCPQSTRDFIKKQLSGVEKPSLRKPQSRSNPKDQIAARMSGKRNPRHNGGAATGKADKAKGADGE